MPSDPNDPSTTRRLYLTAVLSLFRKGMDTQQIAKTLNNREALIERALHEAIALERREKPK